MLKGRLGMKTGLMLMLPVVPKKMVCPSGADLATKSVPTTPPAPGLFSTMTGWPSASDSLGAMMRATMSMPPPGGKPMTMRTGLVGNACACALTARGNSSAIEIRMEWSRLGMAFLQWGYFELTYFSKW